MIFYMYTHSVLILPSYTVLNTTNIYLRTFDFGGGWPSLQGTKVEGKESLASRWHTHLLARISLRKSSLRRSVRVRRVHHQKERCFFSLERLRSPELPVPKAGQTDGNKMSTKPRGPRENNSGSGKHGKNFIIGVKGLM